MKIVADANIPFIKHYFENYGTLVLKPGRFISHEDVKDADILLVRSITPVNAELLSNSSVKFVGSVTTGSDHLDINWLQNAGIDWSLATAFNAPPVADYIVSTIAALQRRQLLKTSGKAAVIGIGNVGKLVVERLKLLQFDVILCDPIRAESEKDFSFTPFDEIKDVDFISLHVPLTKNENHPTHHFISKDFLKRQKPGCVLVNASRGAVIDSQQLMLHGIHLQWCLDVWEHEPTIDLAILNRATLASPHIAGYSVQSKLRGIDMIYRAACNKNWIKPHVDSQLAMPSQQLSFAGSYHHWQDIVLGVFSPIVMTAMMRAKLLDENAQPKEFDEMRNQFSYRHEFQYTRLLNMQLKDEDRNVLLQLGFQF